MLKYKVIGLMSGTSLDGLDVAFCTFELDKNKIWQYEIREAVTYKYNTSWQKKLAELHTKDALTFVKTDAEFALMMAHYVVKFCKTYNCDAPLIASHGHTIFHAPLLGYTSQIGNGAILAAQTGKIVVSDFRTMDVALGGQGAPLVPVGDAFLFHDFDFCINLGGFANISYKKDKERLAFDICPVNFILNKLYLELKNKKNKDMFDRGGKHAALGNFSASLFEKLNTIPYYKMLPPKSLGREWVETEMSPLINTFDIPISDKLCTLNHHIAYQISTVLNMTDGEKVLITGGGAYNDFLISLIKHYALKKQIIIPDNKTIEFKEAMVFAFLGLLRYRGELNCLKSVTGAKINSSLGAIYSGCNVK